MPKRVDAIQPAIVQALRMVGAKVWCLHTVGHGFPDLCALYHGELYLLEVKMPHCQLTPDERKFHDEWQAAGVGIVRSPEEALRFVGAID